MIWFHEIVSEEKQKQKMGCRLPQLLLAAVCAVLVIGLVMPTLGVVPDKANQAATADNCRQILVALKLYANDHDGNYPDVDESESMTSNDAFALLIREGFLKDERIFGAKSSKYYPDNDIGDPPNYPKVLEAGENHWAMTKDVTSNSAQKLPLIFENPAAAGWPPAWNCDAARKMEKGRAWLGGKIVVGFDEGGVEIIRLESAKGSQVGPKPDADGKNVFTRAAPVMEILDIEE